MSRGGRKKGEQTLTQVMAKLLEKELVPDLKERAQMPGVEPVLRQRWEKERAARRTADAFELWVNHVAEQVGAAWVLSIAFVRTLEDRGLLDRRRLTGTEGYDSEHGFFQLFPALGPRDYLLTVLRELSRLPGAEDLLGPKHNPAWRLAPSNAAAQKLLEAWRRDDEARTPLWTFEGTDTRFLGDLYQDLSADVRERYALLQTPDFVERFILKLTLDPAVEEFGLDEVRLIDPTCGSGHFLLGAYDKLFDLRLAREPGLDRRAHALAALGQVNGVDLNPFAVAIARFRLTLAYLEKAGVARLKDAPRLPLNLAVADSLLVAAKGAALHLARTAEAKEGWGYDLFDFEDGEEAERILGRGYHAVVGNPPYITCKDAVLREEYRGLYPRSAAGKFALAAPFTERFFQLGVEGGFVGLINANSFMKREFGKKLVEEVLAKLDLTDVIDAAGAFIPGNGTPSAIFFGRNRPPVLDQVDAVLGKRGEPGVPTDPACGLVWSAIEGHARDLDFENEYVSVARVSRATLAKHPWSLGGGGASELKVYLDAHHAKNLDALVETIGVAAVTGEDDVYIAESEAELVRRGVGPSYVGPFGIGEAIRDWGIQPLMAIRPFGADGTPLEVVPDSLGRSLWPWRTGLRRRVYFGKLQEERGLLWCDYAIVVRGAAIPSPRIAFAFVATHNHFVLDRGGKVFNRTAPIIKLPSGATEDEHLALLAYLNSSTAGFWMKQAFFSRGNGGIGGGIASEEWERFVEHDSTKLNTAPLPRLTDDYRRIASSIELLSVCRARAMPAATVANWQPGSLSLADTLGHAQREAADNLARMCAIQEELDWLVYAAFGLLSPEDEALLKRARGEVWPNFPRTIDEVPSAVGRSGLHPGHRPFEVVLARDCLLKNTPTAWFDRNGYRSPSEITASYAPACQRLIEARVAIIDRNPQIRLIEKPEFKRRWTLRSYADEAKAAAETWLLDAVEARVKEEQAPVSARRLAEEVLGDPKFREVAAWRFGDEAIAGLVALAGGEGVPHVTALRFTDSGLEKRALWERTWDLQRQEDAGEKLPAPIPVPPKYDQKDYRDTTFWRLRGKLDVPKERFISYPGAERDDEKSPIIGWAGWDHLQRAQALAALYQERKEEAWTKERLTPLLAGLLELVPWLKQWHNEPSAAFGGQRLGDYFAQYVESEAREQGLTLDELSAWRPPNKGRGKKQ